MKKTFKNKLALIFFINSVSYPPDGLNKVNARFFSEIFDMCIHHALIAVKIIPPQPVQQILTGQNPALMGQKLPQDLKFSLSQGDGLSVCQGGIVVQIKNQAFVGYGLPAAVLDRKSTRLNSSH